MPLPVKMWTFCSQPIRPARNRNDRLNASANCQPRRMLNVSSRAKRGTFPAALKIPRYARDDTARRYRAVSHLSAEQDHGAFGTVALVMQAAARHGEDLARLE